MCMLEGLLIFLARERERETKLKFHPYSHPLSISIRGSTCLALVKVL